MSDKTRAATLTRKSKLSRRWPCSGAIAARRWQPCRWWPRPKIRATTALRAPAGRPVRRQQAAAAVAETNPQGGVGSWSSVCSFPPDHPFDREKSFCGAGSRWVRTSAGPT